jgi:hypothetical protein
MFCALSVCETPSKVKDFSVEIFAVRRPDYKKFPFRMRYQPVAARLVTTESVFQRIRTDMGLNVARAWRRDKRECEEAGLLGASFLVITCPELNTWQPNLVGIQDQEMAQKWRSEIGDWGTDCQALVSAIALILESTSY